MEEEKVFAKNMCPMCFSKNTEVEERVYDDRLECQDCGCVRYRHHHDGARLENLKKNKEDKVEDRIKKIKELADKLEEAKNKKGQIVDEKLKLYQKFTKNLSNTVIKVTDNLNIVINCENENTPQFYTCYIDNIYEIDELPYFLEDLIYNNIEKIEQKIIEELKNELESINKILK
ncbi:MAG: hypothetical protein ACOCRX_08285 [Candidatus Woesearchaeota archaeon]